MSEDNKNTRRKTGYVQCSVKSCKNVQKNGKPRLFRFPKDKERAKEWAEACDRLDLVLKAEKLYWSNRVCSDHFTEKMFSNTTKSRLLVIAKPVLKLSRNEENINMDNRVIWPTDNLHSPLETVLFDHDYTKRYNKPSESRMTLSGQLAQSETSLKTSEIETKLNVSEPQDVSQHSTTLCSTTAVKSSSTNRIVCQKPITFIDIGGKSYIYQQMPSKLPSISLSQKSKLNLSVLDNFGHQKAEKKLTVDKQVQTPLALSFYVSQKAKLQSALKKLEKENKVLKKCLKESKNDENIDTFFKYCDHFLSADTATFVKRQALLRRKKVHNK
ncbi:uncharacterized protein [Linepithema humile]|uniref:uncharacterized protein n=1 Tax=Linepithema humile TaxID=83485 RepID=UPI000623877C|nr:PREDICTED: uncharacterized protein LOC105678203 [Linepithema humile]